MVLRALIFCHHVVKLVTEQSSVKKAVPCYITVLPLDCGDDKVTRATHLFFSKPAQYRVAEVVLSVSRDLGVVLGCLSISIRRWGFYCKEASTCVNSRQQFCPSPCETFTPVPLGRLHHSSCTRAGWHPAGVYPDKNPDAPFSPFRNCLATFFCSLTCENHEHEWLFL